MGLFAAIAIGGAILGHKKAKKGVKAQKEANRLQREANKLKNKQAKRAFMRNYRQAQGAALATGVGAGIDLESSRVQGAMASQTSQARTAVTEFKKFDELGAAIGAQQDKVSKYNYQSGVFSSISSIAASFIGFSAGSPNTTSPGGGVTYTPAGGGLDTIKVNIPKKGGGGG